MLLIFLQLWLSDQQTLEPTLKNSNANQPTRSLNKHSETMKLRHFDAYDKHRLMPKLIQVEHEHYLEIVSNTWSLWIIQRMCIIQNMWTIQSMCHADHMHHAEIQTIQDMCYIWKHAFKTCTKFRRCAAYWTCAPFRISAIFCKYASWGNQKI